MTKRLIFIGKSSAMFKTLKDDVTTDGAIADLGEAMQLLGLNADTLRSGWWDVDTKEYLGDQLETQRRST